MSPEQLCNASDLDARADLYSLGALLYEWLTGRCPYDGSASYAKLHKQIMQRRMTALATLRPDLSPALCGVITRALAPDRDQRFDSATQMRDALLAALSPITAARTLAHAPSSPRMSEETQVLLESAADPFRSESQLPRRRRSLGFAAAVVAAAAVALGLSVGWPMSAAVSTEAPVVHAKASDMLPPREPPTAAPLSAAPIAPAQAQPITGEPKRMPAEELPWGVDMPEEAPALPEPPPEQEVSAVAAGAEPSARAERRARRSAEREASRPLSPELVRSVESSAPSDPTDRRPKQPKVVRQLDF
jgi:hypothetical protein